MPYLYTHLLPDAWAVSMLGCVKECLLWVFIDKLPCGHVFWVLLALHPGVELLSHIVTLCRGIFLKFLQHLYDEENKTKQNKTMVFFFFLHQNEVAFLFLFYFFLPWSFGSTLTGFTFWKTMKLFSQEASKAPWLQFLHLLVPSGLFLMIVIPEGSLTVTLIWVLSSLLCLSWYWILASEKCLFGSWPTYMYIFLIVFVWEPRERMTKR